MQGLLVELSAIERLHTAAANYEKTLALLRALKAGQVSLDMVTMTADGWNVAELPSDAPPASEDPVLEPGKQSAEP